jgi:hypothetical protein
LIVAPTKDRAARSQIDRRQCRCHLPSKFMAAISSWCQKGAGANHSSVPTSCSRTASTVLGSVPNLEAIATTRVLSPNCCVTPPPWHTKLNDWADTSKWDADGSRAL